jgi:trk system potassium uptake protein TrkH
MTDSVQSPLQRMGARLKIADPIRLVVVGYASYMLIGWLALCLPFTHETAGAGALDHLFTAVSAVSTTGLTTVSTPDTYNFFGELIVLLLIQLGGLGYMTVSSFLILAVTGNISAERQRVSSTVMTMPAGFDVRSFLRLIVLFTFGVEAVGALALFFIFNANGVAQPLWQGIFHSVSAFCTAGFSLFNNSLESYRGNLPLNIVVILLSYLGALGFIVIHDIWKGMTHSHYRVTLTTKSIVACTVIVTVFATVLFALDDPVEQAMTPGDRWLTALFQVMTASTTVGFNTVPIGALSASSLFLLTIVMIIGASPSGTGGGLKTTTVTAMWAVMMSVVDRRRQVSFLGKQIPNNRVRFAVANVFFYLLTLAAGIYALALVEKSPLADQMFECASALGTVGLSRGITGSLSNAGKLIIIALMFLGRVGPIVLGMALFKPPRPIFDKAAGEEDVAV